MKVEKKKWRSPSLGKDMDLTVYGTSGTPILGLPTRGAGSTQWEQFGMIDMISYQLENGYNKLYCVSSIDDESFFNENATPPQRIVRQHQYESYLTEEVVPFIEEHTKVPFLIIAGVDMGGYQAINTALKNPGLFGKAIGMSGIYDINRFMDEYYDDDVYYNNPMDFVPNLNKQTLLEQIRDVDFRLVSYEYDQRKEETLRMSNVMHMKFLEHELDIWGTDEHEEWELWPQMLKTHII